MTATRAIAILLVMTIVAVNAKQLPRTRSKRDFVAIQGPILHGHVISTHIVDRLEDCDEICENHPRCLSYNYQFDTRSPKHSCEINDATGTVCPQDMFPKRGYRYYEDQNTTCARQCPSTTRDASADFEFTYPNKAVTDYVRFDLLECAPPLTSFTVCLWMRTDDQSDDGTIFSYATPNEDNDILVTDYSNLKILIGGAKETFYTTTNDGGWHHICTTWENTAGAWEFYIDGQLFDSGDGLSKGREIGNDGIFILGQDQDDYGDGFELGQSFNGEIYNVNMWNRVLPADEILHMSTDCADGVGNYLRWKDFVDADVYGDVTKASTVSCVP